jgi:hypothetical protein
MNDTPAPVDPNRVHCDGCQGTGEAELWSQPLGGPCPRCDGTGYIDQPETLREHFEALGNAGRNLRDTLIDHLPALVAWLFVCWLLALLYGITFGW